VKRKGVPRVDIQLLEPPPPVQYRREIIMNIDFLRLFGRDAVKMHGVPQAVVDIKLDAVNPGLAVGAVSLVRGVHAEAYQAVETYGFGHPEMVAAAGEPAHNSGPRGVVDRR